MEPYGALLLLLLLFFLLIPMTSSGLLWISIDLFVQSFPNQLKVFKIHLLSSVSELLSSGIWSHDGDEGEKLVCSCFCYDVARKKKLTEKNHRRLRGRSPRGPKPPKRSALHALSAKKKHTHTHAHTHTLTLAGVDAKWCVRACVRKWRC